MTIETRTGGAREDAAVACLRVAYLEQRNTGDLLPLKTAVAKLDENLNSRFLAREPIDTLIYARAAAIDEMLRLEWQALDARETAGFALIAVGGYGRGELVPYSDIDLMILSERPPKTTDWIAPFVARLWDSGLEIGHSVRTLKDCTREAKADLTVITTLMESRLLCGEATLLEKLAHCIRPEKMWSPETFFAAKHKEQEQRHARYDHTGYNLEPNVKGSPGGLRDIQMIGWVANRHFGSSELEELVAHKFLTKGQLKLLLEGRNVLWRFRYALHVLTGRAEDRLLFDHQKQLAQMLGYEDASYTLGVEQMMQRYYRTVSDLSRLNEILLQLFEEAILLDPNAEPVMLTDEFKIRNGYLQTRGSAIFENNPSALLNAFVLLQQHPDIVGISAYTVGLIKRSLHLIDDEFRQSPKNHRLFLQILRAEHGVTHQLRRMNRYGILGLYIPAFGRIVGRMQYDLFHAYTVDEHTLVVVSNLRKFALKKYDDDLPHVSSVMQSLDRPDLSYLSGLYHDIGKGRGGDHSKLGAVDARSFCLEHGLDEADADLVAWLVRHHLLLSMTAQKKDLGDPLVIQKFAAVVKTARRLDFLYVLTVADVRGTNPRLWNSWKASLFQELYEQTLKALRRGLDRPAASDDFATETRTIARAQLIESGADAAVVDELWTSLPEEYFLRYRPEEIQWHTRVLADHASDQPVADISVLDYGLAIFLYTPSRYHTFAHTTAILDELGLDIEDARIVPTNNNFSLDTYTIGHNKEAETPLSQSAEDLKHRLERLIKKAADPDSTWQPKVTRRISRRARMFDTETKIRFLDQPDGSITVMELDTADHPGLLSKVGEVFVDLDIDIAMAKIVTIGEKAEDVFYLTDSDHRPLSDEAKAAIKRELGNRLRDDAAT